MRSLGTFALVLTTLACAREVGTRVPGARAGSDVHGWPDRPASFSGSCDGCSGTPEFQWSFASGDDASACTLDGADSASPTIHCSQTGLWVLRLDVRDGTTQGIPDYANLMVAEPTDTGAGSTSGSTSISTGSGSTGSTSATTTTGTTGSTGTTGTTGTTTATSTSSTTGTSGGPLSGTLVAQRPDGSAATDVLVGDLIELHATPSDPQATCTFSPILVDAQTLPTTVPCTAAVVLKAATVDTTFSVTFTLGAQTAFAASGPVTAHGPVLLNATTAIRTLAADPISGWAIATRTGHSAIVFDPTTQNLDFVTNHTGGIASAGGTVLDLGWSSGNIGRYYEDGTVDTTGTNANTITSIATAATTDTRTYLPVMIATDGSTLVGWAEDGSENEDNSVNADLVADVKDPANDGLSAGVLFVSASGNQVSYAGWDAVHDFALNGNAISPSSVSTSVNHIVNIASSSRNGGSLWLADSSGKVYEFLQTVGRNGLVLGTPSLSLATSGTIDAMAIDVDGPYGDDLWVAGNSVFQRVVASRNTVGAQPTVVTLDLLLSADSIAVGQSSAGRAVYFGADEGLFWATF